MFDVHDPINLQAPSQEYDMEARAIAAKINDCKSVDEVQDLIHRVFIEYFDLNTAGDKQKYRRIAEEIYSEISTH